MPPYANEIKFRFQYVNSSGQTVGWRASAGLLTPDTIQLKDDTLSYRAVLDSTCRDQRLILTLDPQEVSSPSLNQQLINGRVLALQITGAKPADMEFYIDRISSRYLAEKHHEQLHREGRGREFRSVICPHCGATVDLSLLNKTPYIYCRYCETVFQETSDLKTVGATYRLCDECGWFDRVKGYTEFYFYFLLVVYGFSWKRRFLCDTCVNQVFWKVLLVNAIFIIGIIPALWMKMESLTGRDQKLKELPRANALGKKGKYTEAAAIYAKLYERYPKHPGLLLSQSFGHLQGRDAQGAGFLLQESLQHCSNYIPSIRVINRLQNTSQ